MENLKTFESDCCIVIDGHTFIVAEMIVPTTCNNKNGKYDICQIYELVGEMEDDGFDSCYKPVDYFYGASNTPKEIIQTAISYIKDYLNK